MLRGLYNAASALDTAVQNQELIADNLANVTVPGYRRHALIFEAYAEQFFPDAKPQEGARGVSPVRTAGSYTTFETGPLQQTGNPFDLAINGDAFFVLDGPNGPLYTRNGTFELNARNELQTKSGYLVRGQGGPIQIPPDGGGRVVISNTGGVAVNGNEVGRLQLARFEDPRQLSRVGPTLFEGPAPETPPAGSVRVEQGIREGSNVQVVHEMVSMMLGFRFYEAAEKSLRAISDAVSQNTRPQG